MFTSVILVALFAGVSAFRLTPTFKRSHALNMALTSPGANMKPTFDGTFKEAGAPLETYVLELDNGWRALVDCKTATCTSWKDPSGKEYITSKATVHRFPDAKTVLDGQFYPEERAKKVSFDRMIFKTHCSKYPKVEYRTDVTLRAGSLEYDVTIINEGPETPSIALGMEFNIDPACKVTAKKGYTTGTDKSVATDMWTPPASKFKETCFYVKISAP